MDTYLRDQHTPLKQMPVWSGHLFEAYITLRMLPQLSVLTCALFIPGQISIPVQTQTTIVKWYFSTCAVTMCEMEPPHSRFICDSLDLLLVVMLVLTFPVTVHLFICLEPSQTTQSCVKITTATMMSGTIKSAKLVILNLLTCQNIADLSVITFMPVR